MIPTQSAALRCGALLMAGLLISAQPAFTQRDQIFVGARPLSMGGAFLAVADDGHAIFWNPAGLARLERIEAAFDYANLFGLGLDSYHASFFSRLYFIPPLTDYLTFGADWSAIRAGDEELEFRRDQFNFALALQPPKTLPLLRDFSFGGNAKYLRLDAVLEGTPEVDAAGWGWDFGLLYHLQKLPRLPGSLNLGVMIHDGSDTQVRHANSDFRETVQHQNVRWGLSYRPFAEWPGGRIPLSHPIFALDIDERIHAGLEIWLLRSLALRMGWQKDRHTDESPTFSFGLGFKASVKGWPETNVDYTLNDHPVLPNTNRQFGAALVLRDDPRLLRIEEAHINEVFASLYRAYAEPDARFGAIKLRNVHDDTLRANVTLEAKRYFEKQRPQTVVLAPGAAADLPLRAVFKPEILLASEGRFGGIVKVKYHYQNKEYETTTPLDFTLHERNYLTWDDPAKAAAFVTPNDPVVRDFVDAALQKSAPAPAWLKRYNFTHAMLLFDALQSYGVDYRPDAVTPFPLLADTATKAYRLDKVYYPAEFLTGETKETKETKETRETREKRFGDCDDLTVLYASLLQSAGIPTAIVSGPGHVFLMLDTGVSETQSEGSPFPPDLFIKRNGSLWIPVEATMIPEGSFISAWENAASRLQSAMGDSTWSIFEVAASQAKYPPASAEVLPFPKSFSAALPDFAPLWQQELSAAQQWQEDYWQTFEDSLRQNLPREIELGVRNRYGVVLGKNGAPNRARTQFSEILAHDPAFAAAWNNLANVAFVMGEWARAESLYFKALEYNPYSRGTHLNLAILYETVFEKSPQDSLALHGFIEDSWQRAAQLFEGKAENAFGLLGFSPERSETKAAGSPDKTQSLLQRVKKMIDRGFKRYVQKREIRKVPIGRHGVKAEAPTDPDRAGLLSWIY